MTMVTVARRLPLSPLMLAGVAVRRASTRCVASVPVRSALYALALSGVVLIAAYVPVFLTATYGMSRLAAWAVTAVVVVVAAAARLVGAEWTDRRPGPGLLLSGYGGAAVLCVVIAMGSPGWPLCAPLLVGLAGGEGLAGGALLSLLGNAVRADRGAGVSGVAGPVGALASPVLLAGASGHAGGYAVTWVLLALAMLAVGALALVLYTRTQERQAAAGVWRATVGVWHAAVEATLAPEPAVGAEPSWEASRFPPPDATPTAMTIAIVDEPETRRGAAAVVARLAELAVTDELLVVHPSDAQCTAANAKAVVEGLRERLPRHDVVALYVEPQRWALSRDVALVDEFLEVGSLPIVVTPAAAVHDVAAELSRCLQADRMLTVSYTVASGADLQPV